MVLSIQPAAAWTQVTLAWSPNAEPDIAGYLVFSRLEGEDYAYNVPAWWGIDTTCTLDILDENKRQCFVARAIDTEGYESVDSDEVCYEGIGSSPGSPTPPPDDPAPDDPPSDDPAPDDSAPDVPPSDDSAAKYAADDSIVNETDSSYGCFIQFL